MQSQSVLLCSFNVSLALHLNLTDCYPHRSLLIVYLLPYIYMSLYGLIVYYLGSISTSLGIVR